MLVNIQLITEILFSIGEFYIENGRKTQTQIVVNFFISIYNSSFLKSYLNEYLPQK